MAAARFRESVDVLLRLVGAAVAGGLIVNGVFCIKTFDPITIRDWVVSVILIGCGGLLAIAELSHFVKRFQKLHSMIGTYLYFLAFRSGRGISYIILGALALSKVWWMIITAAAAGLIGIINLAFSVCRCLDKKKKGNETGLATKEDYEDPEKSTPNQLENVT